ncbi:hypothetical protein RND81_06G128600 [Saponaria officinalis]|uniref:Uncharacterized protein n=1 Tax=Saponaria officinalis TaxID=3572 RepID=A0AAW1K5V7_SAPOF
MLIYQIITLILITLPNTISQPTYLYSICPNNTSSSNNTQYQTNLNTLFHSLSANATTNPTGFHYTSVAPFTRDAVHGLFLCRGDQNVTTCSSCVSTATSDLQDTNCPNRKVAMTWYDECMVRYSDISFFREMDQIPRFYQVNTQNVTGNETRLVQILGNMMNNLIYGAANGGPDKKYATDIIGYTSLQTLYGLAQCTPDLSIIDCCLCLTIGIGLLPINLGGRTMLASCNVRYEVYPFFNRADNLTLLSSPPPTFETSNSNAHNNSVKKSIKVIIAIIVPVVAASAIFLALCVCFINKKVKNRDTVVTQTDGEDFKDVECLQYNITTLQNATNSFSNENKLGEGGFGSIYQGALSDGKETAVKRLSRSSAQGVIDFKNEVLMVAKLQHRNLARLFGFCVEGDEKLLVYEYLSNKSLDKFLFGSDPFSCSNMVSEPRLRPGFDKFKSGSKLCHQWRAWEKWTDGVPLEFMDQTIKDSYSSHEIVQCIHLGLLCVHESADKRPTMATIVMTLDSSSVTLHMPDEPAFYTKTRIESKSAKEVGSDQLVSKSVHWSVNSTSFSEIEPR